MIEARASTKSFRPKNDDHDGGSGGSNAEQDFHGQKRGNDTHESTTDPEARLYRKGNGKESMLSFIGHALMENRNGLAVGVMVTKATGTAEREAALELVARHTKKSRITLGTDKAYDVAAFVEELRERKITPHMAIQDHLTKTGKRRKIKIDGRTTRHSGYQTSQRIRKRIEEIFGWAKVQAGHAKTKFVGRRRVEASFTLAIAASNLMRLPKLLGASP